MMNYKISRFLTWILIIVFSSGISTSCTYYRATAPKIDPPSKFLDSRRDHQLERNFIVHLEDGMKALTNVQINKTNQTIAGDLEDFDGLERAYYDKLMASDKKNVRRRKGRADNEAVEQYHLYIKEETQGEINEEKAIIHFDDIIKLEIVDDDGVKNSIIAGASAIGIAVGAIGTFLLIACNCPHVYVNNGTEYEHRTNLYTGAIAPQLERHDYKLLPDYFPNEQNFELKIRNDEQEEQYTNLLELIAVHHDKDVEVISDQTGNIYTIENAQSPLSALDHNSNSVLDKIARVDEQAYHFDADALTELSELLLSFPKPVSASKGKLVLRLKNSQWSGFVYDQFNSMFGKRYTKWMEKNRDRPKEEREKWMKEQGINLLVDIKTENGWKNVEVVSLIGDIDFNSIVVPLDFSLEQKMLELRLRTGFLFWELDYVGMDYSKNQPIHIQKLQPILAQSNTGEDFVAQLTEDDTFYMTHLEKGASSHIKFEPIEQVEGKERTLILHSKGYYTMQKQYTGKTYRRDLARFRNTGELSRFSHDLYQISLGDLVITQQ